ncbi:S-layer homology domain-containing protein [Paenibacillus sp. 19GGS1-52]|uniref:S-layer homology domain-containing protein n=1 Tax=Paenibacillus sp. 19GGS1-52 TaxID=2758563 RepID=UPI001EFB923A|nr:S-layer homology domain-containing protein [Paenibacillus sp. 19GGS1-52]ULO08654.1 S-layer homology domain-containing protein [Paenibacillus sp. 19GGS1-52]
MYGKGLKVMAAWVMLLSLLFGGVANAATVVQQTNSYVFIDVKSTYWANEAIESMANQGIITGNPDGSFKPEEALTREQLAKLITLTFGLDLISDGVQTFSDVNSSSWAYKYVESSKEYLTGYFPVKGKPFFDPQAKATREDVAVALVRAMGLETESINAESILSSKFSDYEDISPQLEQEVAVAVDKKLIQGFPNGTFGPNSPINRASVATLLYRVLKSSYTTATKDVQLDVVLPEQVSDSTLKITGKVSADAKVYINDEEVENINGSFAEAYDLDQGERVYEYVFKAVLPNGRSRTVTKQVTYQTTAPKLTVKAPESASQPDVTISGKVTDSTDTSPVVTVNDKEVYVSYNGDWSTKLTLTEGINKIVVTAVNEHDKKTVIEKQVVVTLGGPELTLDFIPETSNVDSVTLSGKATDKNDSYPKIYINDKLINSYGSFNVNMTLKEGENVFTFKATNSLGKSSSIITKKVIFTVGGPELTLDFIPETSNVDSVTLSGKATDKNDSYPKIYINDKLINSYGSFNVNMTLKEGENVFTFKATNSLGKSSSIITKKVIFTVGGPELTLDFIPETSSVDSVTLSGKATDKNDSYPKIYINDKLINSYGSFNVNMTLKEGENVFTFKATNSLGKSSEVITKTIVFSVGGPELKLDYIPESTKSEQITLSGSATDANDSYPKIYLNDKLLSSYGSFNERVTLKEGSNTFVFKVTNSFGKVTTIEKTVVYTP